MTGQLARLRLRYQDDRPGLPATLIVKFSAAEPGARAMINALDHDALVASGVQHYAFEQCMADYRLATVLAPARLACAVALTDGLQAHPGAFWDMLLPRYSD